MKDYKSLAAMLENFIISSGKDINDYGDMIGCNKNET